MDNGLLNLGVALLAEEVFVCLFVCFEGGLIFKPGGSNMQHVTSLSFLLLAYSNYLSHANKNVPCGVTSASPAFLKQLAKRQVTEPQ